MLQAGPAPSTPKTDGGAGHESSFEAVFRRYYARVFNLFRAKGFSEWDGRDLTQEVFQSVYMNMDAVRSPDQFEAWLFTLARNAFNNRLKHDKAQKRSAQVVDLDEERGAESVSTKSRSPLEELLDREKVGMLHVALAELAPQMRRCITARVVDDLSLEEIAARFGISVNTVKAHCFQARQKLGTLLRKYFDGVDLE